MIDRSIDHELINREGEEEGRRKYEKGKRDRHRRRRRKATYTYCTVPYCTYSYNIYLHRGVKVFNLYSAVLWIVPYYIYKYIKLL